MIFSGNHFRHEQVGQTSNNNNLDGKIGFDYDLNEWNTFSVSGNYSISGTDRESLATYNH